MRDPILWPLLHVSRPTSEQGATLLKERFPGISLEHEDENNAFYRWTFGLDTWLDEEQRMLLGLYEHTIRIPGFLHREWELLVVDHSEFLPQA